MNKDIELAILELLSDDETRWTWYNLDRALASRGLVAHGNIASIANALVESGLIEQIPGENPAMPTYSISAKGRRLLIQPT
jgi:DNA-binding PadR family transcriptional regulator